MPQPQPLVEHDARADVPADERTSDSKLALAPSRGRRGSGIGWPSPSRYSGSVVQRAINCGPSAAARGGRGDAVARRAVRFHVLAMHPRQQSHPAVRLGLTVEREVVDRHVDVHATQQIGNHRERNRACDQGAARPGAQIRRSAASRPAPADGSILTRDLLHVGRFTTISSQKVLTWEIFPRTFRPRGNFTHVQS